MILGLTYLGGAIACAYTLYKNNFLDKKENRAFGKEKIETKEAEYKRYFGYKLEDFFIEKKVMNYYEKKPSYEIELTQFGLKAIIDIAGICAPKKIEENLDYIQALFRAENIKITKENGLVILDIQVFENDVEITQPNGNDSLMLPIGFDNENKDIVVDMHRNAGLLINGVPGVGKSTLIKQLNEYAIRNGAKCYYIQLVKNDLKALGVEVADNTKDIIKLTEGILELIQNGENKEVVYVFIDEFSFLTPFKGDELKADKEKIINNISMILRICRSENVRVILSTQKVISDFLPTSISSMLEAKMTFKCGDNTSSTMVIGDASATNLKFREFILNDTEGLRIGKTYSIDY